MSSSAIDHEQVALMARTGVPTRLIAERLGCSARHARRIIRQKGIDHVPNELIGTDEEYLLWSGYRTWNDSYRTIGRRFGLSHETIRKALNDS